MLTPRPGDTLYDFGNVTISVAGLIRAATLLTKVAAIVSLVLVLLATAPLHETFKAAQGLRVPGWLVQLTLLSYRYVFVLAEDDVD